LCKLGNKKPDDNDLKAIKDLIDIGTDLKANQPLTQENILHLSVQFENNHKIIKILVDACPSNLTVPDAFGMTPLHQHAGFFGIDEARETDKILLANTESQLMTDLNGNTPAHVAVLANDCRENPSLTKYIEGKETNLAGVKNKEGKTVRDLYSHRSVISGTPSGSASGVGSGAGGAGAGAISTVTTFSDSMEKKPVSRTSSNDHSS
jgi:hypothetical protein